MKRFIITVAGNASLRLCTELSRMGACDWNKGKWHVELHADWSAYELKRELAKHQAEDGELHVRQTALPCKHY